MFWIAIGIWLGCGILGLVISYFHEQYYFDITLFDVLAALLLLCSGPIFLVIYLVNNADEIIIIKRRNK